MSTDGPESLEARIDGKSLICNGKGSSRAEFQWIELTNNVAHNGHILDTCVAVSFQQWKQRASSNKSDTELKFQCVAKRGTIVAMLNYTASVRDIDSNCRTPQPAGARVQVSLLVLATGRPAAAK
jgi:hypothetical protein